MKKRILICKFHQETNTFSPIVNAITRFNSGDVFEGERIYNIQLTQKSTIAGAVDAIQAAGIEVIPTVFMHSGSGGRVADEALTHFCNRLQHYLKTEMYDGVYIELHGATCTESCDDACGEILELIRSFIGNKPLTASCDLHAKITPKMLKNADAICGYQTYPHIDQYKTGYRAADLCTRLLKGEKFCCAASFIPMLVPPAGYTTNNGAFKLLMDRAKNMIAEGKLLDASIFVVQPWLDVPEIASTVLAIGKDQDAAKQAAKDLAAELFSIRDDMWPDLRPVDEIIDLAEANTSGKPVILADSADSPNGGAVGDSPVVAMRLLERDSKLKAAMFIRDAEAVARAFAMGRGTEGEISFGATLTQGIPGPVRTVAKILDLREKDTAMGNYPELGRTAVLGIGNLRVVLCEDGTSSKKPEYFQYFGIEPKEYDLLAVKANTSFRAFFAPVTELMYVADTPGVCASNLLWFDWKKVPKDMYPFDKMEVYTPTEACLW